MTELIEFKPNVLREIALKAQENRRLAEEKRAKEAHDKAVEMRFNQAWIKCCHSAAMGELEREVYNIAGDVEREGDEDPKYDYEQLDAVDTAVMQRFRDAGFKANVEVCSEPHEGEGYDGETTYTYYWALVISW